MERLAIRSGSRAEPPRFAVRRRFYPEVREILDAIRRETGTDCIILRCLDAGDDERGRPRVYSALADADSNLRPPFRWAAQSEVRLPDGVSLAQPANPSPQARQTVPGARASRPQSPANPSPQVWQVDPGARGVPPAKPRQPLAASAADRPGSAGVPPAKPRQPLAASVAGRPGSAGVPPAKPRQPLAASVAGRPRLETRNIRLDRRQSAPFDSSSGLVDGANQVLGNIHSIPNRIGRRAAVLQGVAVLLRDGSGAHGARGARVSRHKPAHCGGGRRARLAADGGFGGRHPGARARRRRLARSAGRARPRSSSHTPKTPPRSASCATWG